MFGIFDDDDDEDGGNGGEQQRGNARPANDQPRERPPSGDAGGGQGVPTPNEKPTHRGGDDEFDPGDVTMEDYEPTFDHNATEGQMGKEVLVMNEEHNQAYAGSWPRNMMEGAYDNPKQATWIGYKSNPQEGLREIPIEHNAWFRHASVFGTTGYGKTTFLKNIMVQWAYAGYGFCFIDPKGDGVMDLMEELPGHRLDDVIWIDPAPEDSDKVVGVNFLQPGTEGSEEEQAAEKESIIDDLENIIKNETYWGPRMSSVFSTLARGMIESDKNYTLIDMYQVLVDEEYREMFVEDVDDPLVQRYARVIAEEMDQSDLDALVRRLKRLVNNNITREIISHNESSFRIRDAVENGKIILIKNDQDNADAKQMIATGMMRRIWAAIKARKEVPEEERTPYFLIVDEFDDVVTENADVDKMLSKARSFRLSVTLCNQQPSQLPKDIQQAIMGNCDNLLSFNPNNPADASLVMKKFGSYGAQDLTNLGRFKMFTRIMVDNEQSPPFITHTFPDYPPLRTRSEAREAIQKSLEKYGTSRMDPKQIAKEVVLNMDGKEAGAQADPGGAGSDAAQQLANEQGDVIDDEDGISISEQDVLESIYALELKHDARGEFLPVTELESELESRLNEEMYQSISSEAIEKLNESPHVEKERQEGELRIRLTDEGRNEVVDINSGKVATGGGSDHRYILKRAFEAFTMAGFHVEIPEQEGTEMPDGLADIPMDMSAGSPQEMKAKMRELEENYPIIANITDGTDLNIEAETSTINKPKQTLTNLRKAIEEERKCVFAVKDMEAKKGDMAHHAKKGARILMAPPLIRGKDREGNRMFYNQSSRLELEDGVYAVRSQDTGYHTEWWEAPDGGIQLRDRKSGDVIQHFDSKDQALNPTKEDVPAYYRYDQSKNAFIVYINKAGERDRRVYTEKEQFKDDWAPIRPPFIPEEEFPREPRDDDWMLVVFPDDDKDIAPQVFRPYVDQNGDIAGELEPLIPEEHLPDRTDTDTDSEDGSANEPVPDAGDEETPDDAPPAPDDSSSDEDGEDGEAVTPETESETEVTETDTSTPDDEPAPPSPDEADAAAAETSTSFGDGSEDADDATGTDDGPVEEEPDPDDFSGVDIRDFEVVHDDFNGIYHVVDDEDNTGYTAICGDQVHATESEMTTDLDDLDGDLCIACEAEVDG